jgi:phosphatidate phosphatase APP1
MGLKPAAKQVTSTSAQSTAKRDHQKVQKFLSQDFATAPVYGLDITMTRNATHSIVAIQSDSI